MFLYLFFRSSFAAHVLVLSSILHFPVYSYEMDKSCRNYSGNDITGEVRQAIKEVEDMARNAYAQIGRINRNTSTINLLKALFGNDPRNYDLARKYFVTFIYFYLKDGFAVICGDSMVKLVPDTLTPMKDPRGVWQDKDHNWIEVNDVFKKCSPSKEAFTVQGYFIYLCPAALDLPKGRTLAPYKDQILSGEFIDDFALLPTTLFHELYHTDVVYIRDGLQPCKFFLCKFPFVPDIISMINMICIVRVVYNDQELRDYPPIDVLRDPSQQHLVDDPHYLQTLPMPTTYGFMYCFELAREAPDLTVQNPDNLALFALGKLEFNFCIILPNGKGDKCSFDSI